MNESYQEQMGESPAPSDSLSSGQQSPAPSSVSTAIPEPGESPGYSRSSNGETRVTNDQLNDDNHEKITQVPEIKERTILNTSNNILSPYEDECLCKPKCFKR